MKHIKMFYTVDIIQKSFVILRMISTQSQGYITGPPL